MDHVRFDPCHPCIRVSTDALIIHDILSDSAKQET